jgi:hypothetical protein
MLGTRSSRRSSNQSNTQQMHNDKIVRELVDDLRKRNDGLLASVSKRDDEIDRLRQMCWEHKINPQTGMSADESES